MQRMQWQVDALFDLLKELIQDSEGAPLIEEVRYR